MFFILMSILKHVLDIVKCLSVYFVLFLSLIDYLTVFCAVGALTRIDLNELYLSIKYFDQNGCFELISKMQLLYNRFITCD